MNYPHTWMFMENTVKPVILHLICIIFNVADDKNCIIHIIPQCGFKFLFYFGALYIQMNW